MTTPEDVKVIVAYMRRKPTGATLSEMRSALDAKVLDGRKLSGYSAWGFLIREGDKLRLSPIGRELVLAANEETERDVYAQALWELKPYVVALNWIFHRRLSVVPNIDLASHWHEHCRDDLGTDNEETILRQVNCFFDLAQGAGVGNYTMGRRGQQTRLEVNQERLEYLFNKHPIDAAMDGWEDGNELDGGTLENQLDAEPFATVPDSFGEVIKPKDTVPEEIERLKVFISHGKNMEIVEQVKTMLELADLEYEVAVEEEATAIPVPEKVLSAMRSCSAAVICISADDQASIENGTSHINENVLIEIGAAFVLYDRRVVLLWDKRIPTPSNLQGLYRCEFEGDELSWTAGMKLMRTVAEFKKNG